MAVLRNLQAVVGPAFPWLGHRRECAEPGILSPALGDPAGDRGLIHRAPRRAPGVVRCGLPPGIRSRSRVWIGGSVEGVQESQERHSWSSSPSKCRPWSPWGPERPLWPWIRASGPRPWTSVPPCQSPSPGHREGRRTQTHTNDPGRIPRSRAGFGFPGKMPWSRVPSPTRADPFQQRGSASRPSMTNHVLLGHV